MHVHACIFIQIININFILLNLSAIATKRDISCQRLKSAVTTILLFKT